MSEENNAGKVYVFNCYNEPITALSVNGYSAGNITGWDTEDASTKYTPKSVAVDRIRHRDEVSEAQFAYGNNDVVIPWDSFRATTTIEVPEPTEISLDADLIVYIGLNEAILFDQRGHVLDTFEVSVS